jgi:gluconokinase
MMPPSIQSQIESRPSTIVLLMGVSGCGKTEVGRALALRLGVSFFDADDFHPRANLAKMVLGRPLDDADRLPWLGTLRGMIEGWLSVGAAAVLACSALKHAYRNLLIHPGEPICLVHLHGPYDLLLSRMQARKSHFFKPEMLRSQFDALEAPGPDERAIRLDVAEPVEALVERLMQEIKA